MSRGHVFEDEDVVVLVSDVVDCVVDLHVRLADELLLHDLLEGFGVVDQVLCFAGSDVGVDVGDLSLELRPHVLFAAHLRVSEALDGVFVVVEDGAGLEADHLELGLVLVRRGYVGVAGLDVLVELVDEVADSRDGRVVLLDEAVDGFVDRWVNSGYTSPSRGSQPSCT